VATAKPTVEPVPLWERVRAAQLETKLAVAGFAAIAVHVLDDNFFQPQPGMSATDHLISGLVPLAILVAAAAVYPRLRAGLRAALAIVLGVLGIVIGAIEPAYYASSEGLSGDDYTGLVAVAGGVLLIALGATVLWRTRRRDERLIRRYARRALLMVCAVVAAYFVVFPLGLSYGLTHAARTNTLHGNLGAPYKTVAFDASDGLRLKGWLVPAKNGATVIVYPGKKGTQKHARMLVRHGYGVLVFDRRGEGESEGDPNALGWAFDRDLKGALEFLRGRSDVEPNRIGGLGLSVGGEALLQTAAETKDLRAVVSDGAGSRSVREDTVQMRLGKVPEVMLSGVLTGGVALFANQAPPPSLKDLSARITSTPVFLIYAERGAAGEENSPDYYAAMRGPKQIWKIDTTHTHGLAARPRTYERRVVRFFDRTLLD
jgi:dienelactone hydrolase